MVPTKTGALEGAIDVRFGSKAQTCAVHTRCPLSATSGHVSIRLPRRRDLATVWRMPDPAPSPFLG
jgi:hypothetical protein